MMADAGELRLRIEGTLFDGAVDVVVGEGAKFGEELGVLPSIAGRVASLEQERKTGRDPAGGERVGELTGPFARERRVA